VKFDKFKFNDAWLVSSEVHFDERGFFRETFRRDKFFEISGLSFEAQQINVSSSTKGALRGIHFSISKLGQAKWVSCIKGEIRDYIVDLRHDSETFGEWVSVILSEDNGKSVIIPAGFGHAFEAHSEESLISYALTSPYDPNTEMAINPFDTTLNITWELINPKMSERDKSAPTLKDQISLGNIGSDNLLL